MKICKKCEIKKSLKEFSKNYEECKVCHKKIQQTEWRKNNKTYIKEYNEKYRKTEKYKKYQKKYHKQSKPRLKQKEYRKNNEEKIKEYQVEYKKTNKAKISKKQKEYYYKNKNEINKKRRVDSLTKEEVNEINIKRRERYKKNKEKINKQQREYRKRRMKNPKNRLNHNISSSISSSLKRNKNGYHWEDIVGYTINDLKNHLESLWEPWMNWDNYGNPNGDHTDCWHIDHVVPKSWFNYTSYEDEEFKLCWSLKNLQPKEGKINMSKQNKYIG